MIIHDARISYILVDDKMKGKNIYYETKENSIFLFLQVICIDYENKSVRTMIDFRLFIPY